MSWVLVAFKEMLVFAAVSTGVVYLIWKLCHPGEWI